jgi:hypothetical protein
MDSHLERRGCWELRNEHTYIHGTYILFAAEIISGTVNPNLSSILFPNSAGIDQDIFLYAKKNW